MSSDHDSIIALHEKMIKDLIAKFEKWEERNESHLRDSLDTRTRLMMLEQEKAQKWEAHNRDAKERAAMYKEEFEKINATLQLLAQKFDQMHNECLMRPPHCLKTVEESITRKMRLYITVTLGIPASITGLIYCLNLIYQIGK
jgi:Fe2+ transport system protein B